MSHNTRALRLLVKTVIQKTVKEANDDDDMVFLFRIPCEKQPNRKPLGIWTDKAAFFMVLFYRAEKETAWLLHICAMSLLIQYSIASGHHNYARYGLCNIRLSEALTDEICRQFRQGEHVTCHIARAWNGMWTDMTSDDRTNVMLYGKYPRGLIRITVKPNAMTTWYLSLYICCSVTQGHPRNDPVPSTIC